MNKFAATLCIAGTALALSACGTSTTTGELDTAPPYSTERTAGYSSEAAPRVPVKTVKKQIRKAQPERVFKAAQTK